jgi:arylsulfatase A-like enzyme
MTFAKTCLLTASVLVAVVGPRICMAEANRTPRPNILLIFSDDQGVNDVGCYGSEIQTPHIDSLARDGLKFNQFYAASSICTPSRYGLLTGRFAQRSRDQLTSALMFLDDSDARRGIRSGETTFVAQLRSSGYRTHLVGKWHLGHGQDRFWPTAHGFQTFFGHTGGCVDFYTCHYANRPDWYRGKSLVQTEGYATDEIADEALRLLKGFASGSEADVQNPWYLHVAYNAPHFGKAWDVENGRPQNIMQPKASDLKRVGGIADPLRRSFAAKVVGMDDGIGRLLDVLESTGQARNTLVVFMTDHGGDPNYGGSNEPLRGGKATLYEGGLRVPCLVRYPGVVAAGTESHSIASAIDWYPTFAELANIENLPPGLDGESILPILQGQTPGDHRPIVWSTGSHAELGRSAWHAVRDGKWKWIQPPGQKAMLFDLDVDHKESNDVADRHPDIVDRLSKLSSDTL